MTKKKLLNPTFRSESKMSTNNINAKTDKLLVKINKVTNTV